LAREPSGASAPKHDGELDNIIKQAKQAMNKANEHHHVDPVAAVQDVDSALNKLRDALHRNDHAAVRLTKSAHSPHEY